MSDFQLKRIAKAEEKRLKKAVEEWQKIKFFLEFRHVKDFLTF